MTVDFSEHGPFDPEEREVVREAIEAIERSEHPQAGELTGSVGEMIRRLDRLGELLAEYPSVFSAQSLGQEQRDVGSLLDALSRTSPANFDMFLPTRALVSRALVMAEVNFWRLLRVVCRTSLVGPVSERIVLRVERSLCRCLYTRLAEMVLIHIASDASIHRAVRDGAGLALMRIWDHSTYRVSEFLPLLEATWDARRRRPATLGTLMGTSEMYHLISEGCDSRFVEYLVRPDRTEDEHSAFREFLFGATSEHLGEIREQMDAAGRTAIGVDEVAESQRLRDACAADRDPSLALFEFFLYRHLQASARRQANLPGPKRTAEEYAVLHYLERRDRGRESTVG
jgi:hypothetical protein